FQSLIQSALNSGEAYIADAEDGTRPPLDLCQAFGWKTIIFTDQDGDENHRYQAQGKLIGWYDKEGVYLEPESAFKVAESIAKQQSQPLATSKAMLWKHLRNDGHIQRTSEGRNTYAKKIQGTQKWVLFLPISFIAKVDGQG